MVEAGNGNAAAKGRAGRFLAIHTNAFDRIFDGAVIFVALHLLWMSFLVAHIPLYVATALSLLDGAIIAARG